MCNKPYNGWSGGYVTWDCALWLSNEEWTDREIASKAEELVEKMDDKFDRTDAEVALAEFIKGIVDEMNPVAGESSMITDILGWALEQIDFDEIAQGYLESACIDEKAKELEAEEGEK